MNKTLSIRESKEILGLDSDTGTSVEEVRPYYLRLAKLHHPDRGGDAHTFSRICEAYTTITNVKFEDAVAIEITETIFDEVFEDWLGEQDDDVRTTITREIDRLEREEI